MHLRRALLLFAVVLGVAALLASLTGGARRSDEPSEPATTSLLPELNPAPATRGPERLRFSEGGKRERRKLDPGRAAVVTVEVEQPGQVELVGLGLTAPAEPSRRPASTFSRAARAVTRCASCRSPESRR